MFSRSSALLVGLGPQGMVIIRVGVSARRATGVTLKRHSLCGEVGKSSNISSSLPSPNSCGRFGRRMILRSRQSANGFVRPPLFGAVAEDDFLEARHVLAALDFVCGPFLPIAGGVILSGAFPVCFRDGGRPTAFSSIDLRDCKFDSLRSELARVGFA